MRNLRPVYMKSDNQLVLILFIVKMKRFLIYLPLLAMVLTSCVTKKDYESLQSKYQALGQKYSQLNADYTDAKVKIAEYTSDSKSLAARLAEEQQRNKELKEQYAKLMASYDQSVQQGSVNISKLVDEINASNKFIKQLV